MCPILIDSRTYLTFSEFSRFMIVESSGGSVVRALASYHCGPGSISRLGVIRALSLLVLFSALRGFHPGTPVFPSPRKPAFD